MPKILQTTSEPVYIINVNAMTTFRELLSGTLEDNPALYARINKNTYTAESIEIINGQKPLLNNSSHGLIKIGNLQDFQDEKGFSFLNHCLKFKYHSPISEEVLNREFYFNRQFLIDPNMNLVSLISIEGESI